MLRLVILAFFIIKIFRFTKKTKANVILVDKSFNLDLKKNLVFCDDPYYTMAKVALIFYPDSSYPNNVFTDLIKIRKLINLIRFPLIHLYIKMPK